jgi:hypothetical protein
MLPLPAPQRCTGCYLQLRVHLLRRLCVWPFKRRVPQLRRWLRTSPGSATRFFAAAPGNHEPRRERPQHLPQAHAKHAGHHDGTLGAMSLWVAGRPVPTVLLHRSGFHRPTQRGVNGLARPSRFHMRGATPRGFLQQRHLRRRLGFRPFGPRALTRTACAPSHPLAGLENQPRPHHSIGSRSPPP